MITKIEERLKGKVFVTAGTHEVGFTWREKQFERQDVWETSQRDSQEVHLAGGLPRLRTVSVRGPFNVKGVSNSPSRERVFVCRPATAADEPACAQRIFSTLTRRAYRRPVTADDVNAPLSFYKQTRPNGGDFDAGIRAGVARVLASPSFLYRVERDPATVRAGAAHPISDIELASRLSFFLWSSIPDEQLLNAATAGRLRQPGVLEAQVRRMLADPRADALVSNFTGQWLQLRGPRIARHARPAAVPGLRRQHPQGLPQGNGAVLRPHPAPEQERAGAADGRLHLRGRAAGQALRHSRGLRLALPPGAS